ncbi:MAG: OmpH family outer membrane protein [Alphaproteobacteria bacterium]|nr:OmpH family outer membrane protein [Alphaproteobacteria bacterium]
MKKRTFARIFFLSALMIVTLVPAVAYAQISIAVVDVEKVMATSEAAKSIKKQAKEHSDKFETELKAVENQLKKDLESLRQESEKLSKEDMEKKAQTFYLKRSQSSKTLKTRLAKLRVSESKAVNELTEAIFEVCAKIAAEKKYDLIISRGNVIVGAKSLDITDEVMKKLNTALPSVKMTVPAE